MTNTSNNKFKFIASLASVMFFALSLAVSPVYANDPNLIGGDPIAAHREISIKDQESTSASTVGGYESGVPDGPLSQANDESENDWIDKLGDVVKQNKREADPDWPFDPENPDSRNVGEGPEPDDLIGDTPPLVVNPPEAGVPPSPPTTLPGQTAPNRPPVTINPDGTSRQTLPDGTTIDINVNGPDDSLIIVTTEPDGKTTTTTIKNGKVTQDIFRPLIFEPIMDREIADL